MSEKIDIIINEELDSLVYNLFYEPKGVNLNSNILKYKKGNIYINVKIYKLKTTEQKFVKEYLLKNKKNNDILYFSEVISNYSDLYKPSVAIFNNTKYILNFKHIFLVKQQVSASEIMIDALNILGRIYSDMSLKSLDNILTITNFKNAEEMIILTLILSLRNEPINNEFCINKYKYYGYDERYNKSSKKNLNETFLDVSRAGYIVMTDEFSYIRIKKLSVYVYTYLFIYKEIKHKKIEII